MKLLGVGSIWRIWVFWTVYVRSSVDQTSYKCKKHNVIKDEQTEPLYSVLDSNLVSCAVTCNRNNSCLYFVFTSHNKPCDGYEEKRYDDGEDDGTAGTIVNSLQYKQTCMTICDKQKATYNLYIRTGRKRNAGSKADVVLSLKGRCGEGTRRLTNGKDIILRKGRGSMYKLTANSLCRLEGIGLAFSDPCNKDDWFIEYVTVDTQEVNTNETHRDYLRINRWLSAHGNGEKGEQTTGITCFIVPQDRGFVSTMNKQQTQCWSYQICER